MEYLQIFFEQYGELLLQGTWDTIVMTLVSTVFAYIIGIPLGVAVVLTDPKKGIYRCKYCEEKYTHKKNA